MQINRSVDGSVFFREQLSGVLYLAWVCSTIYPNGNNNESVEEEMKFTIAPRTLDSWHWFVMREKGPSEWFLDYTLIMSPGKKKRFQVCNGFIY